MRSSRVPDRALQSGPECGKDSMSHAGRFSVRKSKLIRDDSGSVLILGIGLSVLALAVVTVVINVATLWLARSTLNSLADGAALYAAQAVDTTLIYTDGLGTELTIDSAKAKNHIHEYLGLSAVKQQLSDLRVDHVQVESNAVQVTLSARAHLPFGYFLPVQVERIAATARSINKVR
ncbi:MAG: pilus assembly protein TadG-related protein [Actinomycetes bacterium]